MRLRDVEIDFQGVPPDLGTPNQTQVCLKKPASIASGIEVSRGAYLNFLQIYISANVMLVEGLIYVIKRCLLSCHLLLMQ